MISAESHNTNSAFLKEHILKWEGGLVNHPRDPGGLTNKGVTLSTWKTLAPSLFGIPANPDTLSRMTGEQWNGVFKFYWDNATGNSAIKSWEIASYFTELFWWAGSNGIRVMQRTLNAMGSKLLVDGVIGPQTIAAANAADPAKFVAAAYKQHIAWIDSLRNETFAIGWKNRANDFSVKLLKKLANG